MPFRLMFALCLLVLAGCTSSEPQKASYAPLPNAPSPQAAPVATAPSHQAAPVGAAQSLQAAPAVVPTVSTVPELQTEPTAAFPPSDPAVLPQTDPAAAAVLPPGASNCSTVDGVTLCDAPADSGAGDLNAESSSTDETNYTN